MGESTECCICGCKEVYLTDNDDFGYCYECGGKHNQLLEAIGR